MTNGADVFDALAARLATLLTGHKRIPNPYQLGENNGLFLALGWGLAIAPGGENTNRFSCSKGSLRVTFQLPITRQFFATEHDSPAKANADKALLTDFETVFDDMWANNLVVGNNSLSIISGFTGIQSVFNNKDLYRALIVNLTVEYFRQN